VELEETCQELGVAAADNPEAGGYDIIINATSVGMHDTVGISPVCSAAFEGCQVAVDLIYKPTVSEFLRLAAERGLQTVSGGGMLFLQAYYADCHFLGKMPDEDEAHALYKKYLESEETI
jgi:shikimate dehydrogenase